MSKLNRIAVILLLSQPLVVGTGAAYAFSTVESDSMPGASLAEPGAQFDNLSEQYWSSWGQPNPDYSSTLLLPDPAPTGDAGPMPIMPANPRPSHR